MTKKVGLSRGSDSTSKDGHTASLMVGNEPKRLWMRHSAVDNPGFLAGAIASFLGWRGMQVGKSYAEARPLEASSGERLFQGRCSACHSLGQGDKLGPDLLGVTTRRERAWLVRYIVAPEKMLAERDPIAVTLSEKYPKVRMPNQSLGGDDLAAVLSYLETHGKAKHDHAHHEHPPEAPASGR